MLTACWLLFTCAGDPYAHVRHVPTPKPRPAIHAVAPPQPPAVAAAPTFAAPGTFCHPPECAGFAVTTPKTMQAPEITPQIESAPSEAPPKAEAHSQTKRKGNTMIFVKDAFDTIGWSGFVLALLVLWYTVRHGWPWVVAKAKSIWGSAKADLAAVKADVAALKVDVAGIKAVVPVPAPVGAGVAPVAH